MSFIHCSRCSLQVASIDENVQYFFGINGKTLARFKTCKRCRQTKKIYTDKKKNSSSDESTQSEETYHSVEENDSHIVKVTQVSDTVTKSEFTDALNEGRVMIIKKKSKLKE